MKSIRGEKKKRLTTDTNQVVKRENVHIQRWVLSVVFRAVGRTAWSPVMDILLDQRINLSAGKI